MLLEILWIDSEALVSLELVSEPKADLADPTPSERVTLCSSLNVELQRRDLRKWIQRFLIPLHVYVTG